MQRPVRFFEPSNSMTREKRVLEPNEAEEAQPEQKRHKVPALASVIVEALKVDSLQKLFSSLEPILRRVFIKRFSEKITAKNSKPVKVSEEVERALVKLGPTRLGGRSSPKRIEGPDGRNLQLHFRSGLSLPLFTGGRVEGQQGCAIHVVLLDANTGQFVTSGPESSAKLDVVVLEGDFNNEDDDDWAQEDFESHVVREREGKRPLLTGDLQVPLKEGVGTLGELTFTDNSSWIRSRKFRLGLKIAPGFCEGIRVREAKTDAFTVKDHRGELYKKHYPPALNDEVWRLEKIGKDGSFHKRLNKAGIYTVEEFLRLVVKDLQRLRTILGSGMSNKMWEVAVDHAKTCVLSGKLYVYYSDDTRNVGVVFNNIYELNGLIVGEQYHPAETLSESQKVSVDTLVKKAYDNWMHVVEYDGKALLNFKQSKKMNGPRTEVLMGPADYPAYDQQAPLHRMPLPVLPEQSAMDSGLAVGGGMASSGYDDNPATRYPAHVPHINSNMQMQFSNNASFAPQNQLGSSSSFSHHTQITRNEPMVGLALAPPQSTGLGFQSLAPPAHSSTPNPFEDWSRHRDSRGIEDFFSVDEIRMRSSEMLENDDMQNLLRIISMGGTSANVADETYPYNSYIPSPSPNYSFDEDRSRPSGKAVVGWLKLKAALRWGIFIRKIAAEKRAQLVELDDS